MKLLTLELVGRYKSLTDHVFDLSGATNSVLALIGLNASGKSQLMELIAEVFSYLERRQRADFRIRSNLGFYFSVAFERSGIHAGLQRIMRFHVQLDSNEQLLIRRSLRRTSLAQADADGQELWEPEQDCPLDELLLPHIIGYASGLNENLQRPFMRNAVQYFDVMSVRARRRKALAEPDVDELRVAAINLQYRSRYPGIFGAPSAEDDLSPLRTLEADTPLPGAVFLDYDCTNLIVAALGLLSDEERSNLWPDIRNRHPRKIVLRYDLRRVPVEQDGIADVRQLVRTVGVAYLKGLDRQTSDERYNLYELDYLCAEVTIDFADSEVVDRLRQIYVEPATLFWKLYKLQLLGVGQWAAEMRKFLRDDAFFGHVEKPLKGKLPLSVVDIQMSDGNQIVSMDDLSDGEAQLLHTIGAARLFSNNECIFVFDEPETHLNPSWRTSYHLDIKRAIRGQPMAQALISSHSPFLISSLRRDTVFQFEVVNGQTGMAPASVETFGASFEVLIKKYFGLRSAISETAVREIRQQIDDESISNTSKRQWLREQLGESMERAYLLRRLED